jgi:hypothetical protein
VVGGVASGKISGGGGLCGDYYENARNLFESRNPAAFKVTYGDILAIVWARLLVFGQLSSTRYSSCRLVLELPLGTRAATWYSSCRLVLELPLDPMDPSRYFPVTASPICDVSI